jgi:hypothetical protein
LVGRRAWLPRLSGTGDQSPSWLIRRHQRKPEKYGVSGCPQVLEILTTDPIANRTPMASQAVAGLFQYWGPARAAISGRSLASTMLEQIGQMLTSAFANRLLAAAEEPPTAQRRRRAHHHRQHQGRAARQ